MRSSVTAGRGRGSSTEPGAFATPGLIDAHCHLASLGAVQEEIDLRGVDRLDEVARRVKERIDALPGDSWIIGRNWDQSLWPGGAFPTAEVLDAVAPDRPVWLTRVDGHAGWANSEAMRRAKVTAETPGPVRRPDPQGRRRDVPRASSSTAPRTWSTRVIPRPSPADIARRILAGQALALKAGLTGIHDAGVTRSDEAAYRDLDRPGPAQAPCLRHGDAAGARSGHVMSAVRRSPRSPAPGSSSGRSSSSSTGRWARGADCCSSPTATTPATAACS